MLTAFVRLADSLKHERRAEIKRFIWRRGASIGAPQGGMTDEGAAGEREAAHLTRARNKFFLLFFPPPSLSLKHS